MADPLTPLTPADWRAAMGYFPSGVTIVTSWQGKQPIGSTVASFCSVSLTPPLLLVSLDARNPVLGPIEATGVLGVNILDAESEALARHFAQEPDRDRFADLDHRARAGGAPHLAAAAVFIDCAVEQMHAAADHRLVVARGLVIEHGSSGAAPLLYHKGAFPKSF